MNVSFMRRTLENNNDKNEIASFYRYYSSKA